MHKKTLTIIITAVCVFAIAIVTVGYMLKEGIINGDNLFVKNDANSTSDELGGDDTAKLYSNAFLKEGAECYLDCGLKDNEKCPIYFKFNSLKVSKEMGDFDLCDDWDEKASINKIYFFTLKNLSQNILFHTPKIVWKK